MRLPPIERHTVQIPVPRHWRVRLAPLFLAAALGGCGDWALTAGAFCVSDAGWRVRLFVVDSFGVGIGGARVVYAFDGGPGDTVVCDSTGHCDWIVSRRGLLTVSVISLGYGPGDTRVRIGGDPCRAVPATVYLTRL